HGAARHRRHARDDDVFAQLRVVGHVHETVQLGAPPDAGGAHRGPGHRGVDADLHVVFDDDGADLGHFAVPPAVFDVAEAVAADDDAGMHHYLLADGDPAQHDAAQVHHRLVD